MAGDEKDAEDRTEAPSQRRLDRAREEGQVALSREAVMLATLGAGLLGMMMALPPMARELADVLHHFLGAEASAARLDAACLALLAEPDDVLAVGVAWNLAYELVGLGCSVAWVTSPADEELPEAVHRARLSR